MGRDKIQQRTTVRRTQGQIMASLCSTYGRYKRQQQLLSVPTFRTPRVVHTERKPDWRGKIRSNHLLGTDYRSMPSTQTAAAVLPTIIIVE